MILDNINLNLLRVFEAVCRTGSMTKAASELHLTQSGVSQNIKHLEEVLGQKLFDRVKGKPLPTPEAHELYELVHHQLEDLENALAHFTGEDVSLKGEIKMGVPIEYGNSFIMPRVALFGRENPKVHFKFVYGHAGQMNQLLLRGELDFAIVDSFQMDNQVETHEVGYEVHTLCCSYDYLKSLGKKGESPSSTKKFFENLDYIAYLDSAPILTQWFKHHLKRSHFSGKVRASLMDVQGVGQLIVKGLGLGVLPQHVVNKYQSLGIELYTFEGSGVPLYNRLSLARLKGRTLSPAVEAIAEDLFQNLKSLA